ncbi:MAG: type II toxin-antitoxin system Phd/YefM family antitoxin [Thermomicrobiales bacterium]
MSATEARRHFGQLMRDIMERNDVFVVERSGTPRVVILSIAEYERLGGTLTHKSEQKEHEGSISTRTT